MATTSPDSIYYPVGTDQVAPLHTVFATQASSVQTALNNLATKYPAVANSVSARNALFPNPVQGNRVFRSDMMYTEVYHGIYNATTNPIGAQVAGWYPIDGNIFAKVVRSSTAGLGATTYVTVFQNGSGAFPGMWDSANPTRITLPFAGYWQVNANGTTSGLDGGVLRGGIMRNGTTLGDLQDNISGVSGISDPFVQPGGVVFTSNSSSYIELTFTSNRSSTLVGGTSMTAKYLGPAHL